jgi:hypothetical protein
MQTISGRDRPNSNCTRSRRLVEAGLLQRRWVSILLENVDPVLQNRVGRLETTGHLSEMLGYDERNKGTLNLRSLRV